MFVRVKKHPYSNKSTVLICHSKRHGNRVEQIVLSRIGTSSEAEDIRRMQHTAEQQLAGLKETSCRIDCQSQPKLPSLASIREMSRINSGVNDIVGYLYDQLGFNSILGGRNQEILKAVVLSRFLEPTSKHKASETIEKKFALDISVDKIYRMMDQLCQEQESVIKGVFDSTIACSSKVEVLFFDVTTLHFETIEEDELRSFGFSKDFRFNTTQLVLALATTQEGLPIGIKIFPGNTAEVKTLITCVREWRRVIPIDTAVVVGDRAMMSSENLAALEEAGMQYIIAYPMKKSSAEVRSAILSDVDYHPVVLNEQMYWKKEILLEGQRLIVTYNQKRHKNDAKQREQLIARITKKIGKVGSAKKLISNQGYLKYTTIDNGIVASLNEEKILEESRWDGLHGILTNSQVSAEEALFRYKNLWIIEESFRINKHSLKMRPIYHYTPRRILAHILICYLTFALIRQMQFRLKKNNINLSVDAIREELTEVQHSILRDQETGSLYKMPSHMTENATALYKTFGKEKDLSVVEYETN